MRSFLLYFFLLVQVPLSGAAGASTPVDFGLNAATPPGWRSLAIKNNPTLVLAFQGPEKSSFVLARMNPISLDNRVAVRNILVDVLNTLNMRTKLHFKPASNLESVRYSNGLSAYVMWVNLDDKPRMALVVMQIQETYMIGILISAVPQAMLGSILGSLHPAVVRRESAAASASRMPLDAAALHAVEKSSLGSFSRDGKTRILRLILPVSLGLLLWFGWRKYSH